MYLALPQMHYVQLGFRKYQLFSLVLGNHLLFLVCCKYTVLILSASKQEEGNSVLVSSGGR